MSQTSHSTGAASDTTGQADASELLACVYGELRRLAQRQLDHEGRPATLQATALVHEVWIRLWRERRATWENRAQFFVAAANAMRRILVDRARARARLKRGGAHARVPLGELALEAASLDDSNASALLELDLALDALRDFEPRLAKLVELRAFTGLTETEAGAVLGLSERSVRRDWRAARLWLYERILILRNGPPPRNPRAH